MEITIILNDSGLTEFLRQGRLLPLQKTSGRSAVNLEDIYYIVVRSHTSKIMEKTIQAKF